MSKPIEPGCLVMVVGGSYQEFIGKVGTAITLLHKGGRYVVDSNTELWAKYTDCWVVDFDTRISANVCNNKNGSSRIERHTVSKMVFSPSLLVRINGDDNSLEDSQCDSISKVDTISRVKETV